MPSTRAPSPAKFTEDIAKRTQLAANRLGQCPSIGRGRANTQRTVQGFGRENVHEVCFGSKKFAAPMLFRERTFPSQFCRADVRGASETFKYHKKQPDEKLARTYRWQRLGSQTASVFERPRGGLL